MEFDQNRAAKPFSRYWILATLQSARANSGVRDVKRAKSC